MSEIHGVMKPKINALLVYIKRNAGILVSLLLLTTLFSIITDTFFTASNLVNVLRQVSTNGIIAFGVTFVVLTGGIDLSVGSIVAVTCTISAGMVKSGIVLEASIVLSLIIGFTLGLCNGLIVTKMKIPAFIATLAMMTTARGIACVYTNGKPIMYNNETFAQIGNGFIGPIPFLVIYLFAVLLTTYFLLNKTRFGRYVYAIGGNREAAKFTGIKIDKIETLVYALSGTLSGVIGIVLAGRMYSGQPLAGEGAELDAVAAVVVGGTSLAGGTGTLGGTLIGALIIGILNNGLNLMQVQSYWQMVCKGIVIILAVYADSLRKKRTGEI